MFQTDQPSAVSALPTPAPAGSQGYFTNGNPGTGQAATVVDADWLNMLQSELINVVLAAGLTPSKTVYNQIITAIRILIQGGSINYGTDVGTVNAYAANFSATVLSVNDGEVLNFKAAHVNTGASTFTPNPGVIPPEPIWGANLQPLGGGEVVGFTSLVWSAIYGVWILIFSAGGAEQLAAGAYGVDPPANDRTAKFATTRWVQRNVNKVGDVKMWHGSVANIAAAQGPGWQLADGTNGTADLRNRFIVGAGDQYSVNATGGLASFALTQANLPAHNHVITISDPGHAHSVYDPGHNHGLNDPGHAHGVADGGHSHSIPNYGSVQAGSDNGGAQSPVATGYGSSRGQNNVNVSGTGIGIYGSGTGMWLNASGSGIGIYGSGTGITASSSSVGSAAAMENRPPYYALCFIEYTGIGA